MTRRYRFSASHRLHSPGLSEERNAELYGKCNNPFGHGHNYEVEVGVRGPVDSVSGRAVDPVRLDALVRREVIEPFHHRYMNREIAQFADAVPTTENLGIEIFRRLRESWSEAFPDSPAVLDNVRISETARNIFEVRGER